MELDERAESTARATGFRLTKRVNMAEIAMKLTYGDTVLTASGDNIHMRAWRRAGKPDPLILLVAREPLLCASIKGSLSLYTLCCSGQLK